jgi:ankyrin repeat protein
MKWGIWKALFRDDEGECLNKASGPAAACIMDALLRDVVLALARLLDPAEQGKHQNASIAQLVTNGVPKGLHDFLKHVSAIRNKRLAHSDVTAMREAIRVKYGITDSEVDEAFKQIIAIVNDVELKATNGQTAYDYCEDQGRDAAHLLLRALAEND